MIFWYNQKLKHEVHVLFDISLVIKGILGVLETLGSFLFFASGTVTSIVSFFANQELGEDPKDFIANHVMQALPYFSAHSQLFIAWYLLIHGVIKIFFVICLLKGKMWSYPASIVVLVGFIIYQLYRYAFVHSTGLLLLSAFDALVIVLVWMEYEFLQKSRKLNSITPVTSEKLPI